MKYSFLTNVIIKIGKDGDVSIETIKEICEISDCKIENIVEMVLNEIIKT